MPHTTHITAVTATRAAELRDFLLSVTDGVEGEAVGWECNDGKLTAVELGKTGSILALMVAEKRRDNPGLDSSSLSLIKVKL